MSDISRKVLDSLLPGGSIWDIKPDGDFDKLLDGMGENDDSIATFLECLACIRDPYKTPFLSDLEKEYGIVTETRLTDDQRRMQLAAVIYREDNYGSKDSLQTALNNAGFAVQVHENSPAVDPDIFLNSIPFMVAGGDNAYAGFYPVTPGDYTSIAGKTGGDLLVNGDIYDQSAEVISTADNTAFMYAGNADAVAGRYDKLKQIERIYEIPSDPAAWPFFFFVGGDAVRNNIQNVTFSNNEEVTFSNNEEVTFSGLNELVSIETVDIPISRKSMFENIILKYKPIHSWAGLIINYV